MFYKNSIPEECRQNGDVKIFSAIFCCSQGLESIDFDDNFENTDTSVCLVSGGAEVLMINKQVDYHTDY